MKALALVLLTGCAALGATSEPCSEASLGSIVAECKLKIEAQCPRDQDIETCPAVKECDARADEWAACGGAK